VVGQKRLTFLVNWWDVQPAAPNCVPLEYERVQGLSLLDAAGLKAFRLKVCAALAASLVAAPVALLSHAVAFVYAQFTSSNAFLCTMHACFV
jgi:hypothetical protein